MVSVDDADTNKKFAEEHQADFPMLSDPEKKVATAYGVLGTTGRARRWTFYIGADGKIILIDKMVRTGTAGEDLAAKLAELADKGLVKKK
jgi:thioredoxin-dependent peroxiredoxin